MLVPGVGAASCKLVVDCRTGKRDQQPELRLQQQGLVHETVVSGLDAPSTFAFLPDGRILVGQVDGLIRIVKDGKILRRPFLDLRGRVTTTRTRGFVGLEPDPDFGRNGHVFLMYASDDTARVTRVTARGNRAIAASEVVVLGRAGRGSCEKLPVAADCVTANGIHMGGGLDFAEDGTLFVGTGDGEIGEKEDYEPRAERAQSLDALTGKVLRVTPEGQGLPTNPHWTGDADDNRSKIWAVGLRNPFRLAVRPGELMPYVGDVGWDAFEEINVAARGAHLGWPCYEGRTRALHYRDTAACQQLYAAGPGAVTFPLVQWSHAVGNSVTGGDFRGRDVYAFGDYGEHWLRTLLLDENDRVVAGSDEPVASGTLAATQVRFGPDGDLYYLSITGALHRIRGLKR
jgi:glucose/arabinose dehydrogenase